MAELIPFLIHVHVVPKKSEMIVVKNLNNELVPTSVQNSWRVCIDFRKLNQVTHKDKIDMASLTHPTSESKKILTTIIILQAPWRSLLSLSVMPLILHLGKLLFSLSMIMFPNGWRPRPPKLMMLFGMSKALISDYGSHLYNKTMSTML
ncbi:hypothetical protein CR513_23977, partial [Mucuna pruriens]